MPLDVEAGRKFLDATLDEVRLHHAERYARGILARYDLDDAMHFHEAVLRRELSGRMVFQGQRDHAAHTLTNYLLGWLFFERVPVFREAFRKTAEARRGPLAPNRLQAMFGNVWVFASLLHNVGYILEGSLQISDTAIQHAYVSEGVSVLAEYFDYRFWSEVKSPSVNLRTELTSGNDALRVPRFDSRSLTGVATDLMSVPLSAPLLEALNRELPGKSRPSFVSPTTDAFAIWRDHFREFGQHSMAKRIESTRAWFDAILWDGIPGVGVRVLDHGVCSGLILLNFDTFYFSAVELALSRPNIHTKNWLRTLDRVSVPLSSWWQQAVWGTGAAAVHNIVQVARKAQPEYIHDSDLPRYPKIQRLSIDEDPIAYLGLMVDILQDWDRYSSRRGAYVLQRGRVEGLPLQSGEVSFKVTTRGLVVRIKHEKARGRMREELARCLTKHDQLLCVE